LRSSDRAGEPLVTNDDRNDSLGSLLFFKAGESGDFIVRVTSFNGDGRGRYVLRVGDVLPAN
jgi:hypothetical protein